MPKRQEIVLIRREKYLIDKSIVPHIKWLNKHKFHTIGCCSGNIKDHDYISTFPTIQFFPEIISMRKILLIIKSAIQSGIEFSYLTLKFPIIENGKQNKKGLNVFWKNPNQLNKFMKILKNSV